MAWGYKASITIDHTKCGTADSTDFPVLINGTYAGAGGLPDLRVTGSGGKVTSASGYDICFYADTGLTTKLPHEIQSYTSTTGEIIMWVKIPTLTFGSDAVIYIAYGDSGITTSQEDITNVWRSEYKGVWHLSEASGTIYDSTGNNNDSSTVSIKAYGATGKIGKCVDMTNASGDQIIVGTSNIPTGTSARTISGWKYSTSSSGAILTLTPNNYPTGGYFELRHANTNVIVSDELVNLTGTIAGANAWKHIAFSIDGSKNYVSYINSSNTNSGTWSAMTGTGPLTNVRLGTQYGTSSIIGLLDEVHIYAGVLSQSWITTEYNNQNDPSTFYTMGNETANGGSGGGNDWPILTGNRFQSWRFN